MKFALTLIWICTVFLMQSACASHPLEKSVNEWVQPLVKFKENPKRNYASIWVGFLDSGKTFTKGYGFTNDKGQSPNKRTPYEVGSVTKVFTAQLVAQAIEEGKLKLTDPVEKYFPQLKSAKEPVTLKHLLSHTAGLPRLPKNFSPLNPMDPYIDYTEKDLMDFISVYEFKREESTPYSYSNLGYALMGKILEKVYGQTYFELIKQKINSPYKMSSLSGIYVEEDFKKLPEGYFFDGRPAPPWNWSNDSVFAATGALKASGEDLLKYLKEHLKSEPPLDITHRQLDGRDSFQHLSMGWHFLPDLEVFFHNGSTYGYSSYIGFHKPTQKAVVILASTTHLSGIGLPLNGDIDQLAHRIFKSLGVSSDLTSVREYFYKIDKDLERLNDQFTLKGNPKDIEWTKLQLQHLSDIDQFLRGKMKEMSSLSLNPTQKNYYWNQFAPRMRTMDVVHTLEMKRILKEHGWINISKFGEEADQNAWLLVQHADHDPQFQKEVLKTLGKLWKKGETNPTNYAMLYDRVAASWNNPAQRKKQLYGTQGQCKNGKWVAIPITKQWALDQRRKAVGLSPMKDYQKKMNEVCK